MYEFHVEGIGCASCARKIDRAVTSLDHEAQVDVDLSAARVRVDSVLAPERIAAVISGTGYPASEVAETS